MLCEDSGVRSLLRPLVSVTTYRRWTFLLGGTALLVPYVLIYAALWSVTRRLGTTGTPRLAGNLVMLAAYVAVSTTVAFVPAVRVLCRTAAETLLGARLPDETPGGARSWRARCRTAVWWVLHIGVGGAIGGTAVFGLPLVLMLLRSAFAGDPADRRLPGTGWSPSAPWALAAAVVTLPLVVYLGAGAGALLARLAPALLGPSPADRLAALERRAEQLAERNRLARELHDSVGHALTATTVQAGAALRVLDTDPEFARRALAAIEETGRAALDDLDHVLGLLRDGGTAAVPPRTLADLDGLLRQTRSAGLDVRAEIDGTDGVPPVVSREAYRIVQECLTNALRHAGKVPVTVRVGVCGDRLELEVANPAAAPSKTRAARGGRGLRGVRERVTVLGGRMEAGTDGGRWRVGVTLPVAPAREPEPR